MLRGIRHKESLNSAPERSSSSNSHRTGTDTARPTILGQIYNDEHCVGEATCTPREPGGGAESDQCACGAAEETVEHFLFRKY